MAAQLAADPLAAAVPDEEAEAFFSIAYALYVLGWDHLQNLARAFGVRFSNNNAKARRHIITSVLKQWNNPKVQSFLTEMIPNLGIGDLVPASDAGGCVTNSDLIAAHEAGTNAVWLIRYARNLGEDGDVEGLRRALGERGEHEYRFFLDIGRLTLRRLTSSAETAAAPDHRDLRRRLQAQASQSQALQDDVQRLERTRRDLARAAQRSEMDLEDLLAQARAEVAAAEAELRRRRLAHKRERAEAAAQHAARVEARQRQLMAARRDFAATLAERGASSGLVPLRGYTVTVVGDTANTEGYRLLVESAGGRLVKGTADVTIYMNAGGGPGSMPGMYYTPGEGLAEFERLLRRFILPTLPRHRG